MLACSELCTLCGFLIQAANITRDRLLSFDRAIRSEPHFQQTQISGLTRDLRSYLKTLQVAWFPLSFSYLAVTCTLDAFRLLQASNHQETSCLEKQFSRDAGSAQW